MRQKIVPGTLIALLVALLAGQSAAQLTAPPFRRGGGAVQPKAKQVAQPAPVAQQQTQTQAKSQPKRMQKQPRAHQTCRQAPRPTVTAQGVPIRYVGPQANRCQRDCRCPRHRHRRGYYPYAPYGYAYYGAVPPFAAPPFAAPPFVPGPGATPYNYNYYYNQQLQQQQASAVPQRPTSQERLRARKARRTRSKFKVAKVTPNPQVAINKRLRTTLQTYEANNGMGGRLYLASGKKRYFVRYAGKPRFDDHTILVPGYAQQVGRGGEIPVTLTLEVDPDSYTVSRVSLVKMDKDLWQSNGVTFL